MFIHVLCAFMLVPMMRATSDDSQYCAIRYRRLCQGKGTHVACQFPESGPGLSCENYTAINFDDELKHFIIHYINRRRQHIASGSEKVRGGVHLPKPQIMMLVEWDRELAYLAQRLADQCYFVHDDCRATVRYPYAGQTVGEVRLRRSRDSEQLSAQQGIRRVLDAWWGEKRRVLPRQLTSPFRLTSRGAVWGHFTQLAVWTLRAVGCGAVRHGLDKPRLLLVCDFSHTNMLGQRTITPGPLIPCPLHTIRRPRSQYPLLCAPVRRSSDLSGKQYDDYEDDDDIDELMRVEDSISTKSEVVTRRKTTTEFKTGKDFKMQAKILAPQKAIIINRLEQELVRNKADDKTYRSRPKTYITYHDLSTRKYFERWRDIESREAMNEKMSAEEMKSYFTLPPKIIETFPTRRPTFLDHVSSDTPRFRWKQTRDRPTRPGASALLEKPAEYTVASKIRLSAASLVLDKDDVDQLFKDTGFNLSWRKRVHKQL